MRLVVRTCDATIKKVERQSIKHTAVTAMVTSSHFLNLCSASALAEGFGMTVGLFQKVQLVKLHGLTKEMCIAAYSGLINWVSRQASSFLLCI